jgi:hypothetical protein
MGKLLERVVLEVVAMGQPALLLMALVGLHTQAVVEVVA